MAENRLIIELTYSNRGDGDWSHQIDIFRQIEIERLAAEEEILPSEERLDADEIESLLDDATGGYCETAVWKDVRQRLLDNTCQQRTGRLEEDGCWPAFE
jgi:hypothetical protein